MLTKSQMDVLKDSANGLTNKEIAHKRGTSIRTVEEHLKNIRTRINTKTNAHSVGKAIKMGIIRTSQIALVLILALNAQYQGDDIMRARTSQVRLSRVRSRESDSL